MLGIFFYSRSDPIEVEQDWTILSQQTEVPWIDPLHIMLGLFRFHLQCSVGLLHPYLLLIFIIIRFSA